MASALILLILLVVIAAGLALWGVGIYNGLITARNAYKNAFAQIDVQLQRRFDLIPNLVETVKGYATHEKGTLEDVVKARNAAMSAQGPAQVSAAEGQLGAALGRLIALSEAYPDLKANANFQQLQSELSDIENKLAASRRFFNNAVQEYNTGIQQLPAALFAGAIGFTKKDFFDLGESRGQLEQAPSVKF
jgi:LemA protein